MEQGIRKVSPSTHVITIPNISDCQFFKPGLKNPTLVEKYGVKDKFVCCYTGAIGLSNHLESIIEIADYLSIKKQNVQFLIAGDGALLEKVRTKAEILKLTNITFLGHIPKRGIAEVYDVSDLNLIMFSKQPILETNSPNKFFDGIAAGLPTAINIKGWIKDLVEEHQCGFYFAEEKPEEFLTAIERLENADMWRTFSKNARLLAENKFSRQHLMKTFLELFN
jgi:glycosyltransferase involved in cell wall biosynthesis